MMEGLSRVDLTDDGSKKADKDDGFCVFICLFVDAWTNHLCLFLWLSMVSSKWSEGENGWKAPTVDGNE